MPTAALARLVGDPSRFARQTFGRAPLHVRSGDAAAFADLLGLDDVDRLVTASGLRAPAFRVVRDGTTLARDRVTRRARVGSRPIDDLLDVPAVLDAFADGATIVLQGLHRTWEPVGRFCRELEAALCHPVQANAYLTPPVAQGLDLHEDAHDVFAVQTHGSKRWVVHAPGSPEPWDLVLDRGDVLYLPAGTRHAAQTRDEPSLHLTLGVRTIRWRDLVRDVVEDALRHEELDGSLPAGWVDDDPATLVAALERSLATVRAGLEDQVDPAGTIGRAADAFREARAPDRRGSLHDLLALQRLHDDRPLRRRAHVPVRLTVDGEVASLRLADRTLELPAVVAPVLERIARSEVFRPVELDALIDHDSRLVLCRRLVREGWLTVDDRLGPSGA